MTKCKNRFHKDLLKENADSPSKFWGTVKKLYPTKKTAPSAGSVFDINGSKTSDNGTIANTLYSYSSNVANLLKSKSFLLRDFTWMKPSENNLVPPCSEKFTLIEVSEADVYKELNSLKRKKATGLDNLPPGLLKDAASSLAKPLTHMINLSFKTGVVPTDWKEARVVPVYKSGPRSQVDNYRPISILPTLSKILEKLFHKQLMNHLERNGLLFNYQFEFRAKRSTEQAVIYFLGHIRREADKGRLTGALFIDLSKAFDTISHSVLLSKLQAYGITDNELNWLTDYLFNRKQVVQYNETFSNSCPVFTGVPQGSIIGPLLFLIHFNDAHRSLEHTNIVTYADDTVIFTSSSEMNIIESHLNQDANSLATWFRKNELIINLKKGKTEAMLFGTAKRLNKFKERQLNIKVGETSINCTTQYKYLGVTLDPSLTLDTHLDITCKKAAGRVNLLRRIRSSIDTSTAIVIYNAMIMPLFTYCGSIGLGWPESKLKRLHSVEKRSMNIIKSKYPPNADLRVPNIGNQMKKSVCKFVFDCLQKNVCEPFKEYFERAKHEKCTRNNNHTVKLPLMKTKTGQKCVAFAGGRIFNELPLEARKIESRIVFTSFLNEHFS